MPSELKPCPFCGGQKITPFTGDGAEGIGRCATFCDWCNAEGPHCDTEAEAIAAWNQRPEPATPAGDEELVEEMLKLIGVQKFDVWRQENYSGEHREWKEEHTLPEGSTLGESICRAILPIIHRREAAALADGALVPNQTQCDLPSILSEEECLKQLALLYNYKPDDSRQFTRWNMLVAIAHGAELGAAAAHAAGRADERAEVVAWLLDWADNRIDQNTFSEARAVLIKAAYAIKRGQHERPKP